VIAGEPCSLCSPWHAADPLPPDKKDDEEADKDEREGGKRHDREPGFRKPVILR
jgi:hypothetical protein